MIVAYSNPRALFADRENSNQNYSILHAPTPKTLIENQHEVNRMTRCKDVAS